MASIVILGGGFGGITAALELKSALGADHAVTLIERRSTFMMGLRKLWILVGQGTREEGQRPIASLRARGIDVRQATITAIDTKARVVRTDGGEVRYDYLVVALGAEPRPDLIKGFSPAVYNLYDAGDVERLAKRVAEFRRGRVAVAILGLPYKCPPAPYEAAMLLDDFFRARGVRQDVSLHAYSPQPMTLPVAGKAACDALEGQLAQRRIGFTPNCKLVALEGTKAVFENAAAEADLLIAVPPHRSPEVVKQGGLTGAGEWVPVDPATLRTTVERVWAVGDVTEIMMSNKMPLPKAGVMAEAQARVAAAGIVAEIAGRGATARFDGRGYCFVEVGGGRAAMVTGDFLAPQAPKVELSPPSPEGYEKKREFERSRLAAWF